MPKPPEFITAHQGPPLGTSLHLALLFPAQSYLCSAAGITRAWKSRDWVLGDHGGWDNPASPAPSLSPPQLHPPALQLSLIFTLSRQVPILRRFSRENDSRGEEKSGCWNKPEVGF